MTNIAPDRSDDNASPSENVPAALQKTAKSPSSSSMTAEGARAQQLSSRSPAQTVAKLKEVAAAAAGDGVNRLYECVRVCVCGGGDT